MVVVVALANTTARIAWVVMTRGVEYEWQELGTSIYPRHSGCCVIHCS